MHQTEMSACWFGLRLPGCSLCPRPVLCDGICLRSYLVPGPCSGICLWTAQLRTPYPREGSCPHGPRAGKTRGLSHWWLYEEGRTEGKEGGLEGLYH